MKRTIALGLAILAGAALGAAAVQTLHAEAKPMAYVIAENVVNDQNGYTKDFVPAISKTIQDAGGTFLVRGGKTVSIHGAPPAPRVVILQFESMDKALAWANSPSTKSVFATGEKVATLHDYAVEGLSQ